MRKNWLLKCLITKGIQKPKIYEKYFIFLLYLCLGMPLSNQVMKDLNMKNETETYATKRAAIQAARILRNSGKTVKVMQTAHIGTDIGSRQVQVSLSYFLIIS